MKKIKTMTDAMGNAIPVKYVSAYDKARDRVALRIRERYEKARRVLEKTLAESVKDLEDLKSLKEKTGVKGNFAAQSFDGLTRVAIRQQYAIRIDERVAVARGIMLHYVNSVLDRVNGVDVSALRLLVEQAFKANSSGFLSTGRVLALLRMEVNDPDWIRAKLLLQESLMPVAGKRYLACETRRSTQADFAPIRLDAADCWPEETALAPETASPNAGTGAAVPLRPAPTVGAAVPCGPTNKEVPNA